MRVLIRCYPSCRVLIRSANPVGRETLYNKLVFDHFVNWVLRYKLPDTDTTEIYTLLEEARKEGRDLTLNDAIQEVIAAIPSPGEEQVPSIWGQIATNLDFQRLSGEQQFRIEALDASEIVKTALRERIIDPKDIGLWRRPAAPGKTEKLSSKARAEFERREKEYEEQLAKLKAEVTRLQKGRESDRQEREEMLRKEANIKSPFEPKPPPPPPPVNINIQFPEEERKKREETFNPLTGSRRNRYPFAPEDIDILYNSFANPIERKLKREPNQKERDRFDLLVNTLESGSERTSMRVARTQFENLGKAVAGVGQEGRMIIRHGSVRLQDLIEKQLDEGLTRDEEAELARLSAPGGIREEEIFYPVPDIWIIAESGPDRKTLLGTALRPDKPYPRILSKTWDEANAERNIREVYEPQGFVCRIEHHGEDGGGEGGRSGDFDFGGGGIAPGTV